MFKTRPSQLLLSLINSQMLGLHTCVCSLGVFPISAMDDKSKNTSAKIEELHSDSLPLFLLLPPSLTLFFTLLAAISIKLAPRVLIAVYEAHLLAQEFVFFL